MVPNTFARWERSQGITPEGRTANFVVVKAKVPVAFFNKRSETISGGVRTRTADARLVLSTASNEEVKEADRFVVDQNGLRYRVEAAESSAFGAGYYWYCTLLRVEDDPE